MAAPDFKILKNIISSNDLADDDGTELSACLTIRYLEECILSNSFSVHLLENIPKLLVHRALKVRTLALHIFKQTEITSSRENEGQQRLSSHIEFIDRCKEDPSHKLRIEHVRCTTDFNELSEAVIDENEEIRLAVINRLMDLDVSNEDSFLALLIDLIHDGSPLVRLEFAKALCRLKNTSESFKGSLFDKSTDGLFLYGAEDEYPEVRRALVDSILAFCTESTFPAILEFLIDMLNDESTDVRVAALEQLTRLVKKRHTALTNENLGFVTGCLEESDALVREKALRLLGHLRFSDTKIFFLLIAQQGLTDNEILHCISKIVKRNAEIFYKFLGTKNTDGKYIYRHSIFMKRRGSLYNIEYLAMLLVLKILLKSYSIDISEEIKEDIKFLKYKLSERVFNKRFKCVDRASNEIKDRIRKQEYKLKSSTLLLKDCKAEDASKNKFYYDLYNALHLQYNENDNKEMRRIRHLYEIEDAPACVFDDISHSLEIILGGKIKSREYVLSGPDAIKSFKNVPLDFNIDAFWTAVPISSFLVVKYLDKSMKYQLAPKIHIVLDTAYSTSDSTIEAFIGVEEEEEFLSLSNTLRINVSLIQY
ncbi:hypothetical protein ENBRE01_0863 [Enteropsectra breve]|nr:hypothetical protein ENBRE01_0863 [Enteropsectra breve]